MILYYKAYFGTFRSGPVDHKYVAILQYRPSSSPNLMDISPLASTPGTPLTLSGTFRATGFDDSDDPKDPQSTDTDDEGDDYFTRILIGGRGCNHMKEDGTL